MVNIDAWSRYFVELLSRFCLPTHNIVPHTSLHDQSCHQTMKKYKDFEGMVKTHRYKMVKKHEKIQSVEIFPWSHGNSQVQHDSVIVHCIPVCFHFECSPKLKVFGERPTNLVTLGCWFFSVGSARSFTHLSIDSRHDQWFSQFFIVNVEGIAFMRRTCSRAVLRFNRIKSGNRSHRFVMSSFSRHEWMFCTELSGLKLWRSSQPGDRGLWWCLAQILGVWDAGGTTLSLGFSGSEV